MRIAIATSLFLLLLLSAQSQKKIKLNNFDQSYFTMSNCPYDSSAGAFYISDYGKSRFDHNFEIEFTHHVILKILSPEEYDRADIRIPFSKDDRVSGFEAATYNLVDGKIVESKIKRKDAIIEEVNDETRSFNFTFPNVKEGSIIEYTYRVNYGSIKSLNTWYFQSSLPVIKSQYELVIPTYFNYERVYQGYFPLKKADVEYKILPIASGLTANHQIHNYVAENVPAFKEEPYITTRSDYMSKINFELKRYDLPNQPPRVFIPESFSEIAKQYYESDYWHGSVTDSKFTRDVVEVLKSTGADSLQLIESIYHYVRDNFKEDYEIDLSNQKKVFEEQRGTSSQINRVLAAMLNEAGFETNLVRISTRSHGRVLKHIPIDRQFNFTLVQVVVGEEKILMDATEENIPFKVLPKYCLNGEGLLISNNPSWVPLKPFDNNSITYGGTFELQDGYLTGEFTKRRSGYYAWDFLDDNEDEEAYKKSFNENMETWIIESHEIGELEEEHKLDETLEVEIEGKVDDLGDILYLNPIIYGQTVNNPFKAPTRSFPINYGYPINETHYYQIDVGDQFVVDEVPEPIMLALPNNGGRLLYNVQQNENLLTVTCRIQINEAEFPAEQYPYLREFYAQMIEKQGEQIVLKRK